MYDRVHTDPQMISNVLVFEYFIQVPFNVLELMAAVFLNVLKNVISTFLFISPKFCRWFYNIWYTVLVDFFFLFTLIIFQMLPFGIMQLII